MVIDPDGLPARSNTCSVSFSSSFSSMAEAIVLKSLVGDEKSTLHGWSAGTVLRKVARQSRPSESVWVITHCTIGMGYTTGYKTVVRGRRKANKPPLY
jgi:hypothetical protein